MVLRLTDLDEDSDFQNVGLTVDNVNDAPNAVDDSAAVDEDSSSNQINVLLNDNDPDGDALTIESVTQPSHGTASHNGDFVYYTPTPGYVGSDSFTYTINDGNGEEDTATVSVTVTQTIFECNDGNDNDLDGATDYPDDFGCSSSSDNSEVNNGNLECADGIDNDDDGLIDQADPDCSNRYDDSERTVTVLLAEENQVKIKPKVHIDKLRFNTERISLGEDLFSYVYFENKGKRELDDVSVTVTIPELGIRKKVGPFDLKRGKEIKKTVLLEIPDDTRKGVYYAKITISNDRTKRVRYRPIFIE